MKSSISMKQQIVKIKIKVTNLTSEKAFNISKKIDMEAPLIADPN